MAEYTLNTTLVTRNDTLENQRTANLILHKGEWGIAIDSNTGKSIIKVGDGVHHWKDLSVELGQKECSNSLNEMSNSFKQLQRVAQTSGISLVEAASAIRNLASMGASMSDFAQEKDTSYRTLQYKHEVE